MACMRVNTAARLQAAVRRAAATQSGFVAVSRPDRLDKTLLGKNYERRLPLDGPTYPNQVY